MRIIAGRLRGRRLAAPAGELVRPTSDRAREALFGILERGRPPLRGARFLDLYAGTGAVGLEAASRGAVAVLAVERARVALDALRANVAALGEGERVRVLAADATRLGRAPPGAPFDIAYLDPPYGEKLAGPTLLALAAGGWLAAGARAVAEVEAGETLDAPAAFELEDERRYGRARLVFLRHGTAADAAAASP